MSELKVDKVSPRTGTYVSLNTVGSKNIIINGDMSIAQRATSVSGINSFTYHTVDRWEFGTNSFGGFTMSQDTDVPTGQGFAYSTKIDCTTAKTPLSAGDNMQLAQKFEGQNLQYLKKGTSSAESLTLSFWVKSNKTGTYIAELFDDDNSRQISKAYTIDSASTWEKKTIIYDGDTTGALDNDNNSSLNLKLWLAAGTTFSSGTLSTTWTSSAIGNRAVGQVNLADNTANEWYITGVQLEAGTTASDFEFLPYDVNLDRCYRYYEVIAEGNQLSLFNGTAYNSTIAYGILNYTKEKRAVPTLDHTTGTAYYEILGNASSESVTGFAGGKASTKKMRLNTTNTLSRTQGHGAWFQTNNTASFLAIDAEL